MKRALGTIQTRAEAIQDTILNGLADLMLQDKEVSGVYRRAKALLGEGQLLPTHVALSVAYEIWQEKNLEPPAQLRGRFSPSTPTPTPTPTQTL